jgi:hypothetical protein
MQSGTGTCTVKVNRAGDANYNAAVEVSASATATKINQAALTLTGVPATAAYLSSFTVTPGGGSGSAALVVSTAGVCGNAGNAVTMQSGTGTCTVKVNRAGDANYYPAPEVGASATAAKAGTTTTVAGLTPAPAILGLSVNVSVSVQSVAAPGGTVTVTNGSSSCTAALAGGTGSCSLTASAVGQNAFVVTYPGDGTNFNGSTGQGGDVQYNFTGFFQPIDNLPVVNAVKAGQAVPIKFSLHGNQGLNIFMPNSPASVATSCGTFDPLDTVEETVTAGASSLSYDPGSDQYIYVWKTDKGWAAGSCRELQVTLKDGSVKKAHFKLTM